MDMQVCKSEGHPEKEAMRIVEATTFLDWYLLEKIRKCARLSQEIASRERLLKDAKDDVIAAALDKRELPEEGAVTYVVDGILCRVSSGYDYTIEDHEALRQLLGEERFDELVDTLVEFVPTQRLIDMSCDGDLGQEIRKHVSIRLRKPKVSILDNLAKEPAEQ